MEKQKVSAQPLLSRGARGKKGATAVADTEESPRTAAMSNARRLGPRPAGSPEAALSARSRLGLPQAAASLGQPAG